MHETTTSARFNRSRRCARSRALGTKRELGGGDGTGKGPHVRAQSPFAHPPWPSFSCLCRCVFAPISGRFFPSVSVAACALYPRPPPSAPTHAHHPYPHPAPCPPQFGFGFGEKKDFAPRMILGCANLSPAASCSAGTTPETPHGDEPFRGRLHWRQRVGGFSEGRTFFFHNPFSSLLGTWTERDTDATGQVHFSGVRGRSITLASNLQACRVARPRPLKRPCMCGSSTGHYGAFARAGFRRALVGKTPDHPIMVTPRRVWPGNGSGRRDVVLCERVGLRTSCLIVSGMAAQSGALKM